jgi:Tfp pilus assembly protein PilV
MSKQRITSPAAFTLFEVGVGALILVVGFIGLIQAVTIGTQLLDTAQKEQIAIQIIDAEIEKLRAGTVADIVDLTEPGGYTMTLTESGEYTITVTDTGAVLSGATTRFALAGNPSLMAQAKGFTCSMVKTDIRADFRKVAYTVTWKGNTGRSYSRSAEMYFGLNGLQLSYQKS